MCIIDSTCITNGRRTCELVKETVICMTKTNDLIKGFSAHGVSLDVSGILRVLQAILEGSQTVSEVAQELTIRTLQCLMIVLQPKESRGMLNDEMIATEPVYK
jgi:hypothetical protein